MCVFVYFLVFFVFFVFYYFLVFLYFVNVCVCINVVVYTGDPDCARSVRRLAYLEEDWKKNLLSEKDKKEK